MENMCLALATVSLGYLYYRHWMNGTFFPKYHRADGKTVIITGASAGVGKETAFSMAERGAKVIIACRNVRKGENVRTMIINKTKNINVRVMHLDLASFQSIKKFAETFLKEEPRLDILINNAGVLGLTKSLTEDGLEMHMGINHYGHFLLTLLLLDRLKESKPSRIVTVSSWGHRFMRFNKCDLNSEKSYNRFYAYLQSKIANALFTTELASRLKGSGVIATCIHPGVVHTDISRHLNYFFLFSSRFVCKILSNIFLRSAKSGAQTSIFAALDFNYQTISGVYYDNCKIGYINPDAENEKLRGWLWEKSEEVTGIKYPSDTLKIEDQQQLSFQESRCDSK